MSKFTDFLIKLGVNSAAVDTLGGRVIGSLSALNSSNAGGYMEPNVIDGYTYNEADGNWYGYPPRPDYGVNGWFDPASAAKQQELDLARYWREMNNHVERASPSQGDAGSLSSPSLWDLMTRLPGIIERYREIAPDIWDQLKGYGGLSENGLLEKLRANFNKAQQTISPLVLDLDGLNGAETVNQTAGIHFDHDANQFAEQTGWAGKNDGLLVWDRNANGQIDNGGELFGNHTVLASGENAAHGFVALAELDANQDGVVNIADAAFANLRVFKDANSNGVVDAGELLTLAQAGVKSLNTAYTDQTETDAQGNQHLQAGSYTTTSNETRAMTDVWFAVDTALTVDTQTVEVGTEIEALPDLKGFGNVRSLHQAMARDARRSSCNTGRRVRCAASRS